MIPAQLSHSATHPNLHLIQVPEFATSLWHHAVSPHQGFASDIPPPWTTPHHHPCPQALQDTLYFEDSAHSSPLLSSLSLLLWLDLLVERFLFVSFLICELKYIFLQRLLISPSENIYRTHRYKSICSFFNTVQYLKTPILSPPNFSSSILTFHLLSIRHRTWIQPPHHPGHSLQHMLNYHSICAGGNRIFQVSYDQHTMLEPIENQYVLSCIQHSASCFIDLISF